MLENSRALESANRKVALVPAIILLSIVAYAGIDVALWKMSGYRLTELNGSTLRVLRSLSYCNFINCLGPDSWKPMGEAIQKLHGPDSERLYEIVFFTEKTKFQYPPSALIYYQFLDWLGLTKILVLNRINIVVFICNAAMAVTAFALCLRESNTRTSLTTLDWSILAAAALLFYPTLSGLEVGQIQVWIDLLFSAACVLFLIQRPALAGALIGVAVGIKPQFALFALWAALWNQQRFLIGMIATLVPVLLLSVFLYGLHAHLEYLNVLSFISKHGEIFYRNQTINGLLNRLLYVDDNTVFDMHEFAPYNFTVALATFASVVVFTLIAILPLPSRRGREASIIDFAIVATCATISSPVAWEHHYGIFLPLFFIALAKLQAEQSSVKYPLHLALLTVSWILVANDFAVTNVFKSSVLNVVQSYRFAGGLIFLYLLMFVLRSGTEEGPHGNPSPAR